MSFGFTQRKKKCVFVNYRGTEFDINPGQDPRTIFLNNDL